ncbi:MAG: DNA recombination protein RecN [Campylobacterota bacterium]|nr:DNA recombination protein RecN [Campylobacterota bacterium]
MIERLYLRELVTFDEVELEFSKGLVVLTGPSGAGKSVLMSAILSSFGYSTQGAAVLCELNLGKPDDMRSDVYELESDITVKTMKKGKLRYLIDGQNISKKVLAEMFTPYVKYLSVRDKGGFESETLIDMLDSQLLAKDKIFKKLFKEYSKRYQNYKLKADQLSKIKEDEAKLTELIEYARYEVEKIASINPQIGEEEALYKVKQQLSRMDKIKDALSGAVEIFNMESSVEEVYRLLDKDVSLFTDVMNQLRADFEEAENLADQLEEVNIEEVLDRLGDLSILKNRYGSVEEAIAYRVAKEEELAGFENIEQDKSMLESFLALEFSELQIIAAKISQIRLKEAKQLEKKLEKYLTLLKLPALTFIFSPMPLSLKGIESVEMMLGQSKTATLSGGEFNRLRLALMAITMPSDNMKQGVLILDEIDANVSGDESIAIAQMIQKLSRVYQIFAISHQPHLSAKAEQHIVVTKTGEKSKVEVLNDQGRISEIARIIAGENPTVEAVDFAKKLRA